MPQKISTAVSYAVLAGTSIYCLKVYGGGGWQHFPVGSYGIIVTNSLLGVMYYGIEKVSDKIEKPFGFTKMINVILPLPFIVTEAWLLNGYRKEFAWAHSIIAAIPILQWLADKEKKDIIDLILAVNCISLGYVTVMAENYWGLGAAIMYCFNHFFMEKGQDIVDLPPEEVYNYGLAIFTFLSLYAIGHK